MNKFIPVFFAIALASCFCFPSSALSLQQDVQGVTFNEKESDLPKNIDSLFTSAYYVAMYRRHQDFVKNAPG